MKLPFIYKDGRIEMHFVDAMKPIQMLMRPRPISLAELERTDLPVKTDDTLFYLCYVDDHYEYREEI